MNLGTSKQGYCRNIKTYCIPFHLLYQCLVWLLICVWIAAWDSVALLKVLHITRTIEEVYICNIRGMPLIERSCILPPKWSNSSIGKGLKSQILARWAPLINDLDKQHTLLNVSSLNLKRNLVLTWVTLTIGQFYNALCYCFRTCVLHCFACPCLWMSSAACAVIWWSLTVCSMIARLFGSSVSSSSKCTAAEKQVINRLVDVLRSSACSPVLTYSVCFVSPEKNTLE